MNLPTASALDRALRCPASVVLPQTRERSSGEAEKGITIHRYLERVSQFLATGTVVFPMHLLDDLPEDLRSVCAAIPLGKLGIVPGHGYIAEAAFAWDLTTDTGRFLGAGRGRDYSDRKPTEICGTADRVLKGKYRVIVKDTKTGHGFVRQAGWNPQLRFLALAACRAWGKEAATVEIERIGDDGSVEIEQADLDCVDLDATATELRALASRIGEAEAEVSAGRRPGLSEGRHCTYCPAWEACPAKISLIQQFLAEGPGAMLSGLDLPVAYQKIRAMEAAAKRALGRVKDIIEAAGEPLQLGEGMVYGPTARGFREHAA